MKKIYVFLFILFFISLSQKSSFPQWQMITSVYNINQNPSISPVNENIVWVAGGQNNLPTIFRSTNGGLNWTSIPTTGIDKNIISLCAVNENTCYAGTYGNSNSGAKVFRTTDGGNTPWTTIVTIPGTEGFFNGILYSKIHTTCFIAVSAPPNGAGTPYFIHKSNDGGNTWFTQYPTGVPGSRGAQNSVFIVDSLFYGFGLSHSSIPQVMVTSNAGLNWNLSTLGFSGGFTTGIAFSDNKLIGISGSNSLPNIARTINGGVTWATVNLGINMYGYCQIKWIQGTYTVYLRGEDYGTNRMVKSTDNGEYWNQMSLPSISGINHFDFVRIGNVVYGYAVSGSGQILKLTEAVVIGIKKLNYPIPEKYLLYQNYPNPFNPSTQIKFNLPKSSFVQLIVCDVLGKEVAVLVNQDLKEGEYSVDWNAENLSSGIYYYKIQTDYFIETKKMIFLK